MRNRDSCVMSFKKWQLADKFCGLWQLTPSIILDPTFVGRQILWVVAATPSIVLDPTYIGGKKIK